MKWILGVVALLVVNPTQEFQSRYKRVESYEIRPGVVATPKYSGRRELCEIFVEKTHLQGDTVEMAPTMPRKLVMEIVDELAPPNVRGGRARGSGPFDYDHIDGSVAVMVIEYENVSIQIYRDRSVVGDTAVVLRWDNTCGSLREPPDPKE